MTDARRPAAGAAVREFGTALVLLVVGSGGALLLTGRTWQTIRVPRSRPLADVVVHATGRSLSGALVGLAVVALTGVAAVLATRGQVRRFVGMVLLIDGVALAVVATTLMRRVSDARALQIVADSRSGIGTDSGAVSVQSHPVWAAACAGAAVAVILGAALIAARGHRWSEMSARYEAPASREVTAGTDSLEPAVASIGPVSDARIWDALDRGQDPTGHDD
jgi:uncharacterized membrane protein (TIGR02234 family)